MLPVLLFAALGGMAWAVRGCSGFGGMDGCIFAGFTWGTAWWFIAREPGGHPPRRYASAWVILALTVGIGFSGNRGWMQWPSFFEGHLQTNYAQGKFVPIPRAYGFVWLFIAGVPWAGLGACLLAWCSSKAGEAPRLSLPRASFAPQWDWVLRIGCGVAGAFLARAFFDYFPQIFLPLYNSLQSQYADLQSHPNLRRLINDNRAAMTHLGLYAGFLLAEVLRRDWRNVLLILVVGLVNGSGWSLCQNWKWAPGVWPNFSFNWWRCWESCGGISIGIAYGLAYYLVNRPFRGQPCTEPESGQRNSSPNVERFGAYLGLVVGLGFSLRNGLKGWANIYLGDEQYWGRLFWIIIGPLMLLSLAGLLLRIRLRPLPKGFAGDVFPHAYRLVWLVLIVQNIVAQLITGPYTAWNETVFSIYYLLLFVISAVILHHYHCLHAGAVPRRDAVSERSTHPVLKG